MIQFFLFFICVNGVIFNGAVFYSDNTVSIGQCLLHGLLQYGIVRWDFFKESNIISSGFLNQDFGWLISKNDRWMIDQCPLQQRHADADPG